MGMKKTEIGMIPEEWDVQSFSDTFRVLNNNTYSRAELNYDSGQFKNIDIVNIGLHFFHKDVRLYAASCSEV